MKLSPNLELADVIRSDTAKRRGIDNSPDANELEKLKMLAAHVYEPIVNRFKVRIFISSGFRSRKLNAAVKGRLSSQHCKAEALDIDMDGSSSGITNAMVFHYILENLDFDQLIWEFGDKKNPSWVHVSRKPSGPNRRMVLVSRKVKDEKTGKDKTIYETYKR